MSVSDAYPGRPGAMAFLGVAGMIVAIFGGMFSAWMILIINVIGAGATTVKAANTGMVWSATQGNLQPELASMSPQQRQMILNVMNARHPLTENRRGLVDSLLADHGIDVVSLPKSGFSATMVENLLIEAGRTEDGLADYFVFNSGRLEVSDERSSFRPNGSSEVFQITRQDSQLPGASLSPEDIGKVMASLQGGALNPAQRASLAKYLADPSQQLFSRRKTADTGAGAFAVQQGDLLFISSSTGGWIQMDVDGNVVGTMSKPAITWGRAGMKPAPKQARMLLISENLLSVLLSVLLFLICIGALKYSPATRNRLRWYALAKVLTLGVGAAGLYQLGAVQTWNVPALWAVIYLAAGLAFPVLVLILVSTTGVRNFCASGT